MLSFKKIILHKKLNLNDGFPARLKLFNAKRAVLSVFHTKRIAVTVNENPDASATVEASFVLPLFIFAYLAVMQLMWVLLGQLGIISSLYDTGMSLSVMAEGTKEHKYISSAGAAVLFYGGLDSDYIKMAGIAGDKAGITLLKSKIKDDMSEIYLRADYVTVNSVDLFGVFPHMYTQTLYFRGWIGVSELGRNAAAGIDADLVYVTDYGEVYHTHKDCTYLNPSISRTTLTKALELRNKGGASYAPCKSCYNNTDIVYITDYGTSYHSSANCSGLKRSIMVMDKDSVGNMRLCSKCAKR